MAKYMCKLCKKESETQIECCGTPMELVEETASEQRETSNQEQSAEASSTEDSSQESPAENEETTSSA